MSEGENAHPIVVPPPAASPFGAQVQDTGCGFAKEKLKELFTPFSQVGASALFARPFPLHPPLSSWGGAFASRQVQG